MCLPLHLPPSASAQVMRASGWGTGAGGTPLPLQGLWTGWSELPVWTQKEGATQGGLGHVAGWGVWPGRARVECSAYALVRGGTQLCRLRSLGCRSVKS